MGLINKILNLIFKANKAESVQEHRAQPKPYPVQCIKRIYSNEEWWKVIANSNTERELCHCYLILDYLKNDYSQEQLEQLARFIGKRMEYIKNGG